MTVKESGHQDLFVPFAVFLVPSLGFSLASIGLRLWLVKRANVRRTAHLRAPRQRPQQWARIDFRLLCERFVLQRRQRLHDEQKRANDAARYQAYSYVVLALTEVRCTAVCRSPLSDSTWLLPGCAVLHPEHDPARPHREYAE